MNKLTIYQDGNVVYSEQGLEMRLHKPIKEEISIKEEVTPQEALSSAKSPSKLNKIRETVIK